MVNLPTCLSEFELGLIQIAEILEVALRSLLLVGLPFNSDLIDWKADDFSVLVFHQYSEFSRIAVVSTLVVVPLEIDNPSDI